MEKEMRNEMEKRDGWLTVCACSVNNAHAILKAVAPGTAAAVSQAGPHTGETAGVAPEEIGGETEQRKHVLTAWKQRMQRVPLSQGAQQQTKQEANYPNTACHQLINKTPTPEHTAAGSPPTCPLAIRYLWARLGGVEARTAWGHAAPLLCEKAFCTKAARLKTCTWRHIRYTHTLQSWSFVNIFTVLTFTCTGSTGLVTGLARGLLWVMVERWCAARLAPVPLQAAVSAESMWHCDTLSQSCDTTEMSHRLQIAGSLHSAPPKTLLEAKPIKETL